MSPEHQIILTGIGGQGVQIAATVLASAAIKESMEALQLATYTGAMRGGQSMVSLVLSRSKIVSPPVLTAAGFGVIMHGHHSEEALSKIRPDGFLLTNKRLVKSAVHQHIERVRSIDGVQIASEAGSPSAVSMVMVAAFARITGLVGIDAMVEAMSESVPSYRRERITQNEAALRAGYDFGAGLEIASGREAVA